MTRRRAYLLPLVLFVSAVLMILGTGFLTSRSMAYASAVDSIHQVQARACAYAGIEDARNKLLRDPQFPPEGDDDQQFFSYGETLSDMGGGGVVGTFVVTVDTTYAGKPYYVILVTSTGRTRDGESPHIIQAEFDVAPYDRADHAQANPHPMSILNWKEEGLSL